MMSVTMAITAGEIQLKIGSGKPYPLGVHLAGNMTNIAVYCEEATAVSIALFDSSGDKLITEIPFHPRRNRTGRIWHIAIEGIPPKTQYGLYIDGPYAPERGSLTAPEILLADPYATHLAAPTQWGCSRDQYRALGCIFEESSFDWQEVSPPRLKWRDLIIYEMHVRGFTQDDSSQAFHPGTYLGVIEKIPYLKELGINAIELLPIYEFDECDNPRINPEGEAPLYNYWGYGPLNFFSPMARYANSDPVNEFKTMVRELHRAGIEVILDVVYNHTGEHVATRRFYSFAGFGAKSYYMIDERGRLRDYTGCGNTFNCNHPVTRQLILDSLRYWAVEMRVDGFRFDLASILTRDRSGHPLNDPPLIEAINSDPVLADTKMIAEAWDAGGLYQVGSFPGEGRWAEWNGKYRDDIRQFIKGTSGFAGAFATRLAGSEDLYGWTGSPTRSINFITAHDGFTLNDLVSYNQKHNVANGENNRDGDNSGHSWNCGTEGESPDQEVNELRERQKRNFHLALMLSCGIPMLHMGDEYSHTKGGNNNTYCHDNQLNWFLWDELQSNGSFWRYYQGLIHLRQRHPILHRDRFLTPDEISWHGKEPSKPDWSDESRFVAFTFHDRNSGEDLYAAFNAANTAVEISLPHRADGQRWRLLVQTAAPSPEDFWEEEEAPPLTEATLSLPPHSAILLKACP
jgi:isoamylase